MAGLNTVSLVGRLVRDPEAKQVGQYEKAGFSIAVDRDFGKEKTTDFFDCDAWGKTAEFVNKYLKKGALVAITGRLQQDTWEKDGKKYSKVLVVADKVNSLGKGKSEETAADDDNLDEPIKMSDIPF